MFFFWGGEGSCKSTHDHLSLVCPIHMVTLILIIYIYSFISFHHKNNFLIKWLAQLLLEKRDSGSKGSSEQERKCSTAKGKFCTLAGRTAGGHGLLRWRGAEEVERVGRLFNACFWKAKWNLAVRVTVWMSSAHFTGSPSGGAVGYNPREVLSLCFLTVIASMSPDLTVSQVAC